MSIRNNFKHTIAACYIGYITQAIIVNFASLLFVTFQNSFEVSLKKIGYLVTVNFVVQLIVDLLAAKFADMIGYRVSVVAAQLFSGTGLVALAVLPFVMKNSYLGIIISITLYAIGGGLTEVLVSPIVEACPTEQKSASMSLLHSFYCWGQVGVVLLSTLFFVTVGISNWRLLTCLWAVIPFANSIYFSFVPINRLCAPEEATPIVKQFKTKLFWVFIVLMLCAGSSEQAMCQWSSTLAETGLKVSKTLGDLLGPCMFAAMMGVSRVFYAKFSEKIDLRKFIIGSCALCVISYLITSCASNPIIALAGCGLCGLSVGILWPGVLSLSAHRFPTGGTAMFAFFAIAGDLGCAVGPTSVGLVSSAIGDDLKTGLLFSIIFPIVMIVAALILGKEKIKQKIL